MSQKMVEKIPKYKPTCVLENLLVGEKLNQITTRIRYAGIDTHALVPAAAASGIRVEKRALPSLFFLCIYIALLRVSGRHINPHISAKITLLAAAKTLDRAFRVALNMPFSADSQCRVYDGCEPIGPTSRIVCS
nr:hypothetical protein CFP56_21935 [Quercus suber]